MKFVAVLVIVAIAAVLKRDACKTAGRSKDGKPNRVNNGAPGQTISRGDGTTLEEFAVASAQTRRSQEHDEEPEVSSETFDGPKPTDVVRPGHDGPEGIELGPRHNAESQNQKETQHKTKTADGSKKPVESSLDVSSHGEHNIESVLASVLPGPSQTQKEETEDSTKKDDEPKPVSVVKTHEEADENVLASGQEMTKDNTELKHKEKVSKKDCGKVNPKYNFGGENEMAEQQIIENILPWTMLIVKGNGRGYKFYVGVFIEDLIVVTSGPFSELQDPRINTREHSIRPYAAHEVSARGISQKPSLDLTKTTPLVDSQTEEEFGTLLKFSPNDASIASTIRPVCRPESEPDYTKCLFVGWQIGSDSRHRPVVSAKVVEATIVSDKSSCGVIGDSDDICVQANQQIKQNSHFGPLMCYDSLKEAWSAYGLLKGRNYEARMFLFTSFFSHEKDVEKAVRNLEIEE